MVTDPPAILKETFASSKKSGQPFHLGYRPALDGLRGYAVLAVLGNHLVLPFAKNGYLGVDIFFALSGFLITILLSEEWMKTRSIHLGSFYMRRVLRLYPALLLMLLAVSFITPARAYLLSSLTYTTNWVLALQIQPLNLELGHTWTLAIEEQYYLLWPLLLRFLLRRLPPSKVILFPLCLAALSLALRIVSWNSVHDYWRFNAGTDMHADGLLLGSAFGLAVGFNLLPRGDSVKRAFQVITVLAVGGMVWLTGIQPMSQDFFVDIGILGVSVATLLIVSQMVVFPNRLLNRIFEFPPLVKIGVISYGLYLWQVPILVLMNLEVLGINAVEEKLIKTVLIFIVTILSYRYLETPVRRLKSLFSAGNPHPTGS